MTSEGNSRAGGAWVLLVQRGAPDVLYEAAAMTAAAVSLGIPVTLVWFDSALEALVRGLPDAPIGEAAPGTSEAAGRLLREARESGRVRYLACSASAISARGGIEAARESVDDVVGWPTVITLLRRAEKSFVW